MGFRKSNKNTTTDELLYLFIDNQYSNIDKANIYKS